jgi:hypothetical protein
MRSPKTLRLAAVLSSVLLNPVFAQDAHTPGPSEGYQPAPARKSLLPGAASGEPKANYSDQPSPTTSPPRDADENTKSNRNPSGDGFSKTR